MAISNEFIEAVNLNKIILVRIMLKDSLVIDPTSKQFDEMEKYARARIDNIYSTHDGETLNYDVNTWNKDYMNQEMVSVVNNFSKERVDLLKNMVIYLYKDKLNTKLDDTKNSSKNTETANKQTGIAIAATGAALSIVGFITSQTALIIGGVIVATAGVALIVKNGDNI